MVTRKFFAMTLAILLAGCMAAEAKELAGVKVPDTLSAGGTTLKLNGAGVRKKAIISVYVGGLYLTAPSKDAAAILAADAPKAVSMHFVRSVSKAQLVDSFKEGFEANAKEKAAAQSANIEKLFGMLSDVKEGDAMVFAYVPGKGTTVSKGDKPMGTIEGKEFADAIFALWLGPKPPSGDLKKGMLGA
jgi:hypothetical protein